MNIWIRGIGILLYGLLFDNLNAMQRWQKELWKYYSDRKNLE